MTTTMRAIAHDTYGPPEQVLAASRCRARSWERTRCSCGRAPRSRVRGMDMAVALLRRALTPRGSLVILGGERGGRWLAGLERNLRMMLLAPLTV
jgi:hypothetical protein